jgi:GTP-binding protein HflX
MGELSAETRRQIGVLIDRKGHIQYVMVGDNKEIELPDFKRVRVASGRFRGLRCVHTHLRGEHLTQDDLTDLALLRLDLMAAIDVDKDTGLPGLIHAAHLLPLHTGDLDSASAPDLYAILEPRIPSQLDLDFLELINSLEIEPFWLALRRVRSAMPRSRWPSWRNLRPQPESWSRTRLFNVAQQSIRKLCWVEESSTS